MPNIVPTRIEGVVNDAVGTTLVTTDRVGVIVPTLVAGVDVEPQITGQIWPRGSGMDTATA